MIFSALIDDNLLSSGGGPRIRVCFLLDSLCRSLSNRNPWLLLQNSSHIYSNTKHDG